MEIEKWLILDNIYNKIKSERNDVAKIHSAFESFPEGIEAHYDFYQKIMLNKNLPLPRNEREYLAVLTSEANSCKYCIEHHNQALVNNSVNVLEQIDPLRVSYFKKFVLTLTNEPWKATVCKRNYNHSGLSSAEYAHAVMIVSYFNMANRLAFATDIEIEDDFKFSCH